MEMFGSATRSGIGRLRNGEIIRFSREQGMPNDYIAQILTDDRGNVWFGSNQGISGCANRILTMLPAARPNSGAGHLRRVKDAGLQASFDYCPTSLLSSDGDCFSRCFLDWPKCGLIVSE